MIVDLHSRDGFFDCEKSYEEFLYDNRDAVLAGLQLPAYQIIRNAPIGGGSQLRPDWTIRHPDYTAIVEIKHVSERHETHAIRNQMLGIAQLLMYETVMPRPVKLYLIDMAICPEVVETVKRHNLPITLCKFHVDHAVVHHAEEALNNGQTIDIRSR